MFKYTLFLFLKNIQVAQRLQNAYTRLAFF